MVGREEVTCLRTHKRVDGIYVLSMTVGSHVGQKPSHFPEISELVGINPAFLRNTSLNAFGAIIDRNATGTETIDDLFTDVARLGSVVFITDGKFIFRQLGDFPIPVVSS